MVAGREPVSADIKRYARPMSMKAITGGMITLLGVGMLIGHTTRPKNPQNQPVNDTQKIK